MINRWHGEMTVISWYSILHLILLCANPYNGLADSCSAACFEKVITFSRPVSYEILRPVKKHGHILPVFLTNVSMKYGRVRFVRSGIDMV